MPAVRISDLTERGGLAFDLGKLLEVIRDLGPGLEWRLHELELVTRPPDGRPAEAALQERSKRAEGAPLTWTQLSHLPRALLQTIKREFLGYKPGEECVELALLAVDSSYWVVWARTASHLHRFQSKFCAVEMSDEAEPRRRMEGFVRSG